MKTLSLFLFIACYLPIGYAWVLSNSKLDGMHNDMPDTSRYIYVDLSKELKPRPDTVRSEDKRLLTEAFTTYFVGDENTIGIQVSLSPCQITIIETYRYYGNPHIRLWTFYIDHLQIGPGLQGRIRINTDRGIVYDSRIKAQNEFHTIDLKGIPGDTMDFRYKLEGAWYRYKQTCNEPPEAH